MTDIFPESILQGDVYCGITNHGPDALQNVTIDLGIYRTRHTYTLGGSTTDISTGLSITASLQPGETGVFDISSL